MDRRDLNLTYPCSWDYHIIGEDEHKLRMAVAGVVGNVEYVLSLANRSKRGRYLSLHLTLVVTDEGHRLRLFDELREHADVRYVL